MTYTEKQEEEFWETHISVHKDYAQIVEEFFVKSGALGFYEVLYQEGVTKNLESDYTILYFFFHLDFPVHAFAPLAMAAMGIEDYQFDAEKKKYADYLKTMEETFESFELSDNFWLITPWNKQNTAARQALLSGAKAIMLKPAFAFGTGRHETTQLMTGYLQQHVEPADIVYEVGCGSGILCLCAMVLGARSAYGVDVETLSIQNSRENLQLNLDEGYIQSLKETPGNDISKSYCEFELGDFNALEKVFTERAGMGGQTPYKNHMFLSNILPKVFYQNEKAMRFLLNNSPKWALSGINRESAEDFKNWLRQLVPDQRFAWKELNEWFIFYKNDG